MFRLRFRLHANVECGVASPTVLLKIAWPYVSHLSAQMQHTVESNTTMMGMPNVDDDLLLLLPIFSVFSFMCLSVVAPRLQIIIIRRSRTRTAITIIYLFAAMPKYC